MSHLEDLIAEYCPDGVEYRELQEIFTIRNGYTPSKKESTYWENGTIPWFRMEDIRQNGRVLYDSLQHITPRSVKGSLFPANSIIISTLATIGLHALIKNDFLANQQFTCLTRKINYKNRLLPEFISYYCFILADWCQVNINVSGFASVDMSAFKKFLFPLPPIPIQEEIVRILDTFNTLEAELEAELEARILQYEHYRANLLDFSSDAPDPTRTPHLTHLLQTLCPDGVVQKELGDVVNILDSQRKPVTKSDRVNGIYPYYGANGIQDYVDNYIFDGTFLLMGEDGSVINEDNSPVITWAVGKIWVNNHAHVMSQKEGGLLRYLYYYLQIIDVFSIVRGVPPKINQKSLREILVPVPPLPIQQEIVAILDRFEALVSDLKDGLPAEIAARRKQYEYYRNQLLTFKPKPPHPL